MIHGFRGGKEVGVSHECNFLIRQHCLEAFCQIKVKLSVDFAHDGIFFLALREMCRPFIVYDAVSVDGPEIHVLRVRAEDLVPKQVDLSFGLIEFPETFRQQPGELHIAEVEIICRILRERLAKSAVSIAIETSFKLIGKGSGDPERIGSFAAHPACRTALHPVCRREVSLIVRDILPGPLAGFPESQRTRFFSFCMKCSAGTPEGTGQILWMVGVCDGRNGQLILFRCDDTESGIIKTHSEKTFQEIEYGTQGSIRRVVAHVVPLIKTGNHGAVASCNRNTAFIAHDFESVRRHFHDVYAEFVRVNAFAEQDFEGVTGKFR